MGLLPVLVAVVVARNADIVVDAVAAVVLAALAAVLVALLLGWLLGGPSRPTRLATSLVSGVQANGPALAIVQALFASPATATVTRPWSRVGAAGSWPTIAGQVPIDTNRTPPHDPDGMRKANL